MKLCLGRINQVTACQSCAFFNDGFHGFRFLPWVTGACVLYLLCLWCRRYRMNLRDTFSARDSDLNKYLLKFILWIHMDRTVAFGVSWSDCSRSTSWFLSISVFVLWGPKWPDVWQSRRKQIYKHFKLLLGLSMKCWRIEHINSDKTITVKNIYSTGLWYLNAVWCRIQLSWGFRGLAWPCHDLNTTFWMALNWMELLTLVFQT